MWTTAITPESKIPTPRVARTTSFWGNHAYLAYYLHTHTQFSFFCFCTKDICIKTRSLLLSNSFAPAVCVLFPIKILGFQPPHHFYKEWSELASLAPFSPREHQALSSQTPLLCLLLSWVSCVLQGPAQNMTKHCVMLSVSDVTYQGSSKSTHWLTTDPLPS